MVSEQVISVLPRGEILFAGALDNPEILRQRFSDDDDVGARRRDGRVAASNAPRKCPDGKGWIGGGAQAPSAPYRRLGARAEGEKRTTLSVVIEVPVRVNRECEYM